MSRAGDRTRRTPFPRRPGGGGSRLSLVAPALLLLQAQVPGRVPNRIGNLPGDSVSLQRPPLPGGLADVVRRLFDAPQVLQIGGAVVGVLILVGLVAIAWWQRAELMAWFTLRSRRTVLIAGAVAAVFVVAFGWVSLRSWNYMMHDNDFCSGCHVMAPAWQKFQTTKHAQLQCHQCHQQSIFASARQLVLWVADRPGQIPTHSKVPNERCIACHVRGDSTRWKQIAATEGHRLHLESPRLPGLQCVRCHGFSVHQFVPTDMTCGQAGCHEGIRIRLGKMSNVTTLHCAMCHVFTRRAAAPMSVRDSVRRWLTPTRVECFACHAMQKLMVDQQLAHDPHGAVCGACHNPHTQTAPVQAERSCTNAACHARADTLTAAHRGLPPGALASCVSCHRPHSWETGGKGDCANCHGNIFQQGGRGPAARVSQLPPAMPWGRVYARLVFALHAPDPVAAFARGAAPTPAWTRPTAGRSAPPAALARGGPRWAWPIVWRATPAALRPQPADTPPPKPAPKPAQELAKPAAPEPRAGPVPAPLTAPSAPAPTSGPYRGFSHALHRNVACTSCHSMTTAHGALLIHSVEDCLRCHHGPAQRSACTGCHPPATLPQNAARSVTVSTSVAPAPSTRTLPFSHAAHPGVACRDCHQGPPTYRTLATCTSCHASHHTPARQCRVCHTGDVQAAHGGGAHLTCGGAGCHRDPAVAALAWSRPVCLACHANMVNHNPGLACERCHAVPPLRTAGGVPSARAGG